MPPSKRSGAIQLLEIVNTISEILRVMMSLLFWAVTLPLAGLVEVGVLITQAAEHASVPAPLTAPSPGRL